MEISCFSFFQWRDHVEDRGKQINSSISTAKDLQKGLIDTQGIQEHVTSLEKEFSALVVQTEHWNDEIADAIVNVKAFEDEMKSIETRWDND